MLVDLRPKRVTGKAAEASLERAHITANKNAIPFDPEKPADHLRHPPRHARPPPRAASAPAEFREIGLMINEVLEGLARSNDGRNAAAERAVGERVQRALRPLPDLRPGLSEYRPLISDELPVLRP